MGDPDRHKCYPMDEELPRDRNAAAAELVRRYACSHVKDTEGFDDFDVQVVWQCHVLGNAKWLMTTTLRDGRYYEVAYSASKAQYYLDVYDKSDDVCVDEERGYA